MNNADLTAAELEAARFNMGVLEQLLTAPQSGALMQWFIMTAIEHYADTVLTSTDEALQNPLIDPKAWKACAQEAKEAMDGWKV